MQHVNDIPDIQPTKGLKDFIPLVFTFFIGLMVISVYQNTILFFSGVLDSIFNKSLLILSLHHIGFVAVSALLLSFLFKALERKKYNLGFKTIKIILLILLVLETSLVTYYVQNYEALGSRLFSLSQSNTAVRFSLLWTLGVSACCMLVCHFTYTYISSLYAMVSRMYPFTIILFSLFLATLYSEKRPVNENKTQYLLERVYKHVFNNTSYEGKEEYPLLKNITYPTALNQYFDLNEDKPDIKIIIVEGLGVDFTNENRPFTKFMPNLSRLKGESLFWNNFLSNTGESHAALPTIIGSLPFGEEGFTYTDGFVHRNTLYSILQNNGYATSCIFGGNSALHYYDRFLGEEKVDWVLDKKAFGNEYTLQDSDAAGISLGYPDRELFKRYTAEKRPGNQPNLDVFLTLSTKQPYRIPNHKSYIKKVDSLLKTAVFDGKTERQFNNNKELFASFMYTDEAIASFLASERKLPNYANTIYIITGSHYTGNLPQDNALKRYRVPLFFYSPLLKSGKELNTIASHGDIAPTILSFLDNRYHLNQPDKIAWLGSDLLKNNGFGTKKKIPLLRSSHNIQDYLSANHFLTDGDVYTLDEQLNLLEAEDEEAIHSIKQDFVFFKSVNSYTIHKDKIVPPENSLVKALLPEFTKEELVWIESVFNGKDFDNAYTTAKRLAIGKDWKRAQLLCRYILSEIPRHADAEILLGRLYSWQENYEEGIKILEKVIKKYPNYEDGYCALLDTYYWSDQNEEIYRIADLALKNQLSQELLTNKITRAHKRVQEKKLLEEIDENKSNTTQSLTKN